MNKYEVKTTSINHGKGYWDTLYWYWVSKYRIDVEYDVDENEEFGIIEHDDFFKKIEGPYYDLEMGFVAGCVWGDDSSWKIQHLDLTECNNGIIKRDDRFGYIELPYGLELKNAIFGHQNGVNIAHMTYFDKAGKKDD